MDLVNNNTAEFDLYLEKQENLVGIIRVSASRAYGCGYDDAMEDAQERINSLENEFELLEQITREQDKQLTQLASHVGRALNAFRKT